MGKWYLEHREEVLKRAKQRYATDSEFREHAKRYNRNRYHTDRRYRTATLERAKARYERSRTITRETACDLECEKCAKRKECAAMLMRLTA